MNDSSLISVAEVLKTRSIDQLNAAADEYFNNVNKFALLQKPFNDPTESAEVLLTMMHVLKGLRLQPGSIVLDFGAGSCWSSSILAGFGYRVIALDVSRVALKLGEELLQRKPILVDHSPIRFLHFDGYRIDLPNESVDAICCLSAFHHVPNQNEVLAEMFRVLKPWGRAGFSEPGPTHSRTPQSQHEMRNHCVLENDIILEDVWKVAQQLGFTDLETCLFYPEPVFVSLDEFNTFLDGQPSARFDHNMRLLMAERRLFVMQKGMLGLTTSAVRTGLDGSVEIDTKAQSCTSGSALKIWSRVRNTGTSLWRPSDDQSGPVRLGPVWISPVNDIYYPPRQMLPMKNAFGMLPGESCDLVVSVEVPSTPGRYILRLQLVAEVVAWFGNAPELIVDVSA
jgi:SAM-dependent methyltransferase